MGKKEADGRPKACLETQFDSTFATALALREKQIQQSYRPVIGVHKWFARRPGSVFRCLLLSEFNGVEPLSSSYWRAHAFRGVIADPFMGGGTPLFEANRLGFHVIGTDINPMAFWVVRQSLDHLDRTAFLQAAEEVVVDVERQVGDLYETECTCCGATASVKYFLWVKTARCTNCNAENDLFPGFLLAEAVRHPRHVVVCQQCGDLNELADQPSKEKPARCASCGGAVHVDGFVRRQRMECRSCKTTVPYLAGLASPPRHRLWAIEYNCAACKPAHQGRFFKKPDAADLARVQRAERRLTATHGLLAPDDEIPSGDETDRLHRWGYRRYRDMFNDRQLLGLGTLLRRIRQIPTAPVRHALLTVFSDSLRYQNMLCRYDTYALKCQDIFSVHGFPVGLVQCENSLLGIPKVGSGSFRHFVEKYVRAKDYCAQPFEVDNGKGRKRIVPITGERIDAELVHDFPRGEDAQAWLSASSATAICLPPRSLDGVFTDPPYFDNVQYAELMDFCFAWLRHGLADDFDEFRGTTTRAAGELTGNITLGRGLEHFTNGLSEVFQAYTRALKPRAPFVFTYHHNDPTAYVPVVVAILDAGLLCTATLPAAAEMGASLHIAGTGSSVLDSVFVCRAHPRSRRNGHQASLPLASLKTFRSVLSRDADLMAAAGIRITAGDLRCLAAGHIARFAIALLTPTWDPAIALPSRMAAAQRALDQLSHQLQPERLISSLTSTPSSQHAAAV
jgi:adenine-specific DNA methylase